MAKILAFNPKQKLPFYKNYNVVSFIFFFAILFYLLISPAFAQGNNLKVPNVQDPSEGWAPRGSAFMSKYVPERTEGRRSAGYGLLFNVKVYMNPAKQMMVGIFSWPNKDGTEEEFGMVYTGAGLSRFAINVDGKWYPAAQLSSEDSDTLKLDNPIVEKDYPVKIRVSMETVEGFKSRVLELDR